MAFPIISSSTDLGEFSGTSWAAFSTFAVQPGEMAVVLIASDGVPTLSASQGYWTELIDFQPSQGTATSGIYWYRNDTGAAVNVDFTLTLSASEAGSIVRYVFAPDGSGRLQIVTTQTNETNTASPNGATIFPGGTITRDYMFISTAHIDGAATLTTSPAGYSTGPGHLGAASGASIYSAYKTAAAVSENPGSFTISPAAIHSMTGLAIWEKRSSGMLALF